MIVAISSAMTPRTWAIRPRKGRYWCSLYWKGRAIAILAFGDLLAALEWARG